MTDDVVSRAKSALEGVTAGPWKWERSMLSGSERGYDEVLWPGPVDCMSYCYGGTSTIDGDNLDRDREFIAAARTLVPELVAEVECLRAERDELGPEWGWDVKGRKRPNPRVLLGADGRPVVERPKLAMADARLYVRSVSGWEPAR